MSLRHLLYLMINGFCLLMVLWIEFRASCMLGKCSTTKLHLHFFSILRQGISKLPRLALYFWYFFLTLLSSCDYRCVLPMPGCSVLLFSDTEWSSTLGDGDTGIIFLSCIVIQSVVPGPAALASPGSDIQNPTPDLCNEQLQFNNRWSKSTMLMNRTLKCVRKPKVKPHIHDLAGI
jgi:hypothetical protein